MKSFFNSTTTVVVLSLITLTIVGIVLFRTKKEPLKAVPAAKTDAEPEAGK